MLLTAVLGSLLTGASAAHAQAPDPVCRMVLTGTLDVICTVPAEADGRRIDFIQWTRDGNPLPQFDDIRQILVSCSPGETFVIGVTIGFTEDVEQIMGSTRFTCRGKPLRLTYFDCDTGNSLLVCGVNFEDGTSPITVSWNIDGVPRPDLLNNTVIRTGCVPGKPYRAVVTVRDPFDSFTDVQSHTCSRIQQ
ncbi:hypothetical protein [Nonomuraea typhae]|uniref:Ig-like domain-containing protein n=1 Tax=Nonomuraea typhae TaxID=2603600 RepID=A0ABW7YPR9_9ACTN